VAGEKKDHGRGKKGSHLIEHRAGSKEPIKEGETPRDFRVWEKKLKDCFPSALLKMKEELLKRQGQCDPADNAGIANLSIRVEAIDRVLLGGALPAKKQKPAARPRPVVAAAPKELSEKEMLESAEYAQSIGMRLTEGQKAALKKAGIK